MPIKPVPPDELNHEFTLRDYETETKSGKVKVTERQYRAVALDFLMSDEIFTFDLWAGKLQAWCREGWEGPTQGRHVPLRKLVAEFLKMMQPDRPADAESNLVHVVQLRIELLDALALVDDHLKLAASKISDGTGTDKDGKRLKSGGATA